ncbi:zincin-like metallopeptidase domain-containing protein [Chryseobacterium sp. SL1]|uniref:zincin-like metallopeptidase domain-containing protein n=1 Tax=Chryseobacterium sp. SL1 TaxID=2995159 RepID=UPI0022742B66|nr:zincin-like metallopeptidase domain-containing protein [Chryseobacterium sp. SL1]MCY1659301.1 zincin-like metallopeptidase domain-containing protein [Chryseobacterium sp. SL1]
MATAVKKIRQFSKDNASKEDKFISKILENLDKVNASDWEMYANLDSVFPSNLFSKKRYKGFNIIALFVDTIANKFKTSKYATFNSISKAGGKLRKGARGCIIEFFSFSFKHKETGKYISSDKYKTLSEKLQKEYNKIPILKNFTVFNSEFIENLSEINLNIESEEPTENEVTEQENCEIFIQRIQEKGELRLKFALDEIAFYTPTFDYIQLPERKYFLTASKYYSTLFHEIIHWSGHQSRLNRDLAGHKNPLSYSFEELIAEMGSMLICLQFGISEEFINSVRYLKGWSSKNTDREESIRKAFTESKRAKKYLENL